jgi:hypothetical protein
MNKKPAQTILTQLRGGLVLNQLTDELHAATVAAHEQHKAATVTLTITIKPEGTKGVSDALLVTGTVASKLPEREQPGHLFFFNEDEGLSENRTKSREPELPGLNVARSTGGS